MEATAEIEKQKGWSVQDGELIVESDMTRVYDVPCSVLNKVEYLDDEGYSQTLETRAYTDKLTLSGNGDINIIIRGKRGGGFKRDIGYPYNLIHNDVLFCFKRNKFHMGNEFAINYDLLALDFALVVILNFDDSLGELHIASRDEWTQNGRIGANGEELQLFLPVDNNRVLPLPAAQVLLMDKRIQKWMKDC